MVRKLDRHKYNIRVGHGSGVAHGKWVPGDGLDGAPHVDDLVSGFFEQLIGTVAEPAMCHARGGIEGLIHVHSVQWPRGSLRWLSVDGAVPHDMGQDMDA